MNKFEKIFMDGQQLENVSHLIAALDSATEWKDAYWIGKSLFSQHEIDCDKQIIEAFEKAFDFGLNVFSAKEQFFDATQITAKLFFQYKEYEAARNLLMLLVENQEQVPDWVHLYYASSQIHTSNILRIAEDPSLFFARLGSISSTDPKDITHRDAVYKEFLRLLAAGYRDCSILYIDSAKIIEKALDLNLHTSVELRLFRDTVCPDFKIPFHDQMQAFDECKAQNIQATVAAVDEDEDNEQLEKENDFTEKLMDEQTKQIEAPKKELTHEKELLRDNELLRFEIEEKEKELAQLKEKNEALLQATSQSLPEPIIEHEVAPTSKQDLNGHGLLERNTKILVIGGSVAKEKDLNGVAKEYFGFENGDFEFVLDYDKIKTYTSRIKPYSNKYAGIIIGPNPHSTEKLGDYSSFIQKLQGEEGYPHTEEARDGSGQLKLSKESFKYALHRMVIHLQSVGN